MVVAVMVIVAVVVVVVAVVQLSFDVLLLSCCWVLLGRVLGRTKFGASLAMNCRSCAAVGCAASCAVVGLAAAAFFPAIAFPAAGACAGAGAAAAAAAAAAEPTVPGAGSPSSAIFLTSCACTTRRVRPGEGAYEQRNRRAKALNRTAAQDTHIWTGRAAAGSSRGGSSRAGQGAGGRGEERGSR